MKARGALLSFLGLLSLASCGGNGDGIANVLLVASVEVSPDVGSVVLGGTAQLTATPKTATGIVVPGRQATWSSSNEAAVSVSSSGLITAHALGGPVTITATVDGISGESQITVQPFPVAGVSISPSQTSVMVNQSVTLTPTAYDSKGNVLPSRVFTWQSSNPSIAAITTNGIVLGVAEGGPVTITATSEGKSGTATVTVTSRPGTKLGFTQQPATTVAGQPVTVKVAIQNDQGGTVSGATSQVTISLGSNPPGGSLTGTTTVNAVNGVATFSNLVLSKVGTYTLVATSTGLTSATSASFNVIAGSATRLAFTTPPPSTAASGAPLSPQPVLQLQDASGNAVGQSGVVVTASVASGTATLSGSVTATTNSAGTATFTTLTLTGNPGTVTLSFNASGVTGVTSSGITISGSTATRLALATQPPSSAVNGVVFSRAPVVQLESSTGNAISTSGVPVTVSIATGSGTLNGTVTVNTNTSGRATFNGLSITGLVGSYTLRFTAPGMTEVVSNTITLSAGPATSLAIVVQPSSSAQSDKAFAQQPVIQLLDSGGNPAPFSGVGVTATLASGLGVLGGGRTKNTNGSGIATYSDLKITGTGTFTIRFSASGLTGVTSAPITVVP